MDCREGTSHPERREIVRLDPDTVIVKHVKNDDRDLTPWNYKYARRWIVLCEMGKASPFGDRIRVETLKNILAYWRIAYEGDDCWKLCAYDRSCATLAFQLGSGIAMVTGTCYWCACLPATLRCTYCEERAYCSDKCRASDWAAHHGKFCEKAGHFGVAAGIKG